MNLVKKINKLLLVVLLVTLSVFLVKPTEVKVDASTEYVGRTQELRAVWVSHYAGDLKAYSNEAQYKEQIINILNNMESMGFNTMIFHIRTHNNAMYDTELNPVASWWSKVDFDTFDPLEWMIEECHKRGIEFHAWLNPYRVSSTGVSDLDSLAAGFPEVNPASDKANYLSTSGGVILNPGLPHVRDFIVKTCMEVVEKYDVDAIHFDDYFYISGCNDDATRAEYNTEGLSKDDFRRKQVDLFMEQLSNAMYEYNVQNNKTVQLGISPSGIYRNGSYGNNTTPEYDENGTLIYPEYSNTSGFAHYGDYLYSDTKKWIDEEWIDYILPQTYWAISHTSASYAKLTKWWSWAVENKKTNLYIAVGVYMALENTSSGQYWKQPDEVKNELLDANQYDKIAGISFYKYSSLLSSSSLMQGHVQDLKSMWNKDVPGSVQQRYTHLLEPDVENIKILDNILSWDACDDVRGYIVWQVEKNRDVDTKDINQLYKYTQSTSIEIEEGYDYYVSTVNLANEISDPLPTTSLGKVDRIINLINGIKIPVTLDEEDNINNILNKYNNLTEEEKSKVTNYSVLEFALSQIESIKSLELDAKEFEECLVPDTTSKYLLPKSFKDYSVSWEYVKESDKALYDIETGKVLVEYLATTIIPLKYTISKNGVNYSNTFKLNIGYVKQSEIGLIYRNTPNSLNKEEDKNAAVSFIGWSGKALKFNNFVFYIADKNYHELTSSEITKGSWSSCGNVYVNKSNKTITGKVSDFSIETRANYGYLIIGSDGIVRLSVDTANATDSISLAPGEILYSSNYLDGLINNSPLKPATGISVGTKVELVTPVWKTDLSDDEVAQEVIDLIDSIPENLTLNHQALIEQIEAVYNNLTDSVKGKVTNKDKLVSAKNKIEELIKNEANLLNKKDQSIKELETYITNLDKYSDSGKKQIANILEIAKINIAKATTENEVESLLTSYKTQLDDVLTQAEEDSAIIGEEREKAITEIKALIPDLTIYSNANQTVISELLSSYIKKINEADTVTSVLEIKEKALVELNEVPTLVDEYRKAGLERINSLTKDLDYTLYSSTNGNKIKNAILTAKTNVNKSVTEAEINTIITSLESLIGSVKTKEEEYLELQDERDEAISVIKASVNLDDYSNDNKALLEQIIKEYTDLILNATTASKIVSYKADALSKIKEVPVDELLILKRSTKEEARIYIDSMKVSELGKNQLETLYEEFVLEIDDQTISSKITILFNQFKKDADKIKKDNPVVDKPNVDDQPNPDDNKNDNQQSCSFIASYICSMLFTSLLISVLILKKRQ